jgi:hypothetical protein
MSWFEQASSDNDLLLGLWSGTTTESGKEPKLYGCFLASPKLARFRDSLPDFAPGHFAQQL